MQAGALDRRMTFQRSTSVPDGGGGYTVTWEDLATVSAARIDVSDSEKYAAGRLVSAKLSRFTVRSSSVTRAVTAADRISHESITWNIDGIKDTRDGRKSFLEITATAEL